MNGITIKVDPRIVGRTMDQMDAECEGIALAAMLEAAAVQIREQIQILPWPGGEWLPETHRLVPGVTLYLRAC